MRYLVDRVVTAVAVTGALLAVTPAAWAVPRYASPTGTGDCSVGSPCDLETAVAGAVADDEVILAPGDYGSAVDPIPSQISTNAAIAVHGAVGAPRPRIFSVAANAIVVGAGATLRDVEIQHSGAGNALLVEGVAERVVVRSQFNPCELSGEGAALLDSVCWATESSPAVSMSGSGSQLPETANLRNVTAYSIFGDGIHVTADNFAQLQLNATNVIASGGSRDVQAEVAGSMGTMSATVNLDYSNFSTRLRLNGASVTAPGSPTNQTLSPLLVDDALGDFHQLARSPTVDAGITDAGNGAADFEGESRLVGASTDIGADEFTPPAPLPVAPKAAGDRTKPVLTALRLKPRAFRARRGSKLSFNLSEAAVVTFTARKRVLRRVRVRVRGRVRVRKRARSVPVRGSFQRRAHPGTNKLQFDARLRGKLLKRGRYKLVATPRDGAGNSGKAVSVNFRIVRR
jgi:hypothetical protein